MSNRQLILTKLDLNLTEYLETKTDMPSRLRDLMFLELELDTDNLNGDYFKKRNRDEVWEEIILDRFSYSDINWYLKDEDNSEIMEYLTKQMTVDNWKICFEKFGANPRLSEVIECSLMNIFNEIFDILYPVILENIN